MQMAPPVASLHMLLGASCRVSNAEAALDAFRTLATHPTPPSPLAEPALLRSLALALGERYAAAEGTARTAHSGTSTSAAASGKAPPRPMVRADVSLLSKALRSSGLPPDKDSTSALVRLSISAGQLREARLRLGQMCLAREPAMPPGGELLAAYVAACGHTEGGAAEGLLAFQQLSPLGPLDLGRHIEVWRRLVPSCCAQAHPEAGYEVYKAMRSAKHELPAEAAVGLLVALEKGGHAAAAFEVRAVLRHLGVSLPKSVLASPPANPTAAASAEAGGEAVGEPAGEADAARADELEGRDDDMSPVEAGGV